MAEMEGPSQILEIRRRLRMAEVMAEVRRAVARTLFENFASKHGFSEVEAATCIFRNPGDLGHQMGTLHRKVLVEVENYAWEVLKSFRCKKYFEEPDRICEDLCFFPIKREERLSTYVPLVKSLETHGQGFIHGKQPAGTGVRSSLLHRDNTRPVNTATVGSRRYVHYFGDSGSTASLENHHSGSLQLLDDDCREEYSYKDQRLQYLTPTGRGLSQDINPRVYDTMLEHTPVTGDGEAGGWNIRNPAFAYIYHSSQLHNLSAEVHPTSASRLSGSTGAHTSIDIRALLLQSADFVGEEPRETDSENASASRILETTIATLLPAAVVNARDFFSDAPDIAKLAGNLMLPALLGFCLIGMLHKRRAGSILRLATCAVITATTFGVSSQLSHGIYIFIAAVAGVVLSFITLTA